MFVVVVRQVEPYALVFGQPHSQSWVFPKSISNTRVGPVSFLIRDGAFLILAIMGLFIKSSLIFRGDVDRTYN